MPNPRSLEALGLLDDPLTKPLTYPGGIPQESGLLDGDSFLQLRPVDRLDVGRWQVETARGSRGTDAVLDALGEAPIAARRQVLAVGSNAAPAQMRRKFIRRRVSTVLPLVRATVHGVASGVSAHVSPRRYVPAAPIEAPGEQNTMCVLWLDEAQLAALDRSEPNYRRVRLSAQFPVDLPSGERLDECDVYVSRWGGLTDAHGRLRRLGDQRELLTELLAESAQLRALVGESPEEFVDAARHDELRDQAREVFVTEGWVRPQPALEQPRRVSST